MARPLTARSTLTAMTNHEPTPVELMHTAQRHAPPAASNPLSTVDTTALAFAFGMLCTDTSPDRDPGRLSTLADELNNRGVLIPLMRTLDPALAKRVTAAIGLDRGARWRRFGQRDPLHAEQG